MLDRREENKNAMKKIEKWNASPQIENETRKIWNRLSRLHKKCHRKFTEMSPNPKTRKEFILRKDDIVTSYDDNEKVVDMFNVWRCLFLKISFV